MLRITHRFVALASVLVIGIGAAAACSSGDGDDAGPSDDAPAATPSAAEMLAGVEVTGPVTNGDRGHAFAAPDFDLGAEGYVADEFFFGGEATAYDPVHGAELGGDGRWELEPTRTAEFETRMLVMRPDDGADFSGTVWVHWLNVTAGFEIGDLTVENLRDGDVVVYVSAQKVGIDGVPGAEANGLRGWDPERYGSLTHPGDDFSYDVFTKAALLVGPDRPRQGTDPLDGLDVEQVLGTGASQSAFRLTSYLNGVQPLTGALDGALLVVSFGRSATFHTPEDAPDTIEADTLRTTQIRDDLDIPVLLLSTETEAASLYPVRQPDSDTFRTWEIAGASHAGAAGGIDDIIAVFTRDGLQVPTGEIGSSSGALGLPANPNFLRWLPVNTAARDHLARWAAGGDPPPELPLIAIAGTPPAIERDDDGNALGGIRLPEMDVPVATYQGTDEGADLMSSLFGTMTPFPPERLAELYPTRASYLDAYGQALQEAVDAGYVLPDDAAEIIATAQAANVPR